MKVQIQPGNVLWAERGYLMFQEECFEVSGGKRQYDLEVQRGAFPADDAQAIFAQILPAGVILLRLLIEEILVKVAVYGISAECGDLSLDQCKLIEGITKEQMRHTGFG